MNKNTNTNVIEFHQTSNRFITKVNYLHMPLQKKTHEKGNGFLDFERR